LANAFVPPPLIPSVVVMVQAGGVPIDLALLLFLLRSSNTE